MTMTQEEKNLLLQDLCARLSHGVIVQYKGHNTIIKNKLLSGSDLDCNIEYYKPYLRPMSSMTKEELTWVEDNLYIADSTAPYDKEAEIFAVYSSKYIDWLNTHNFDYRGLIEKGLAIEAPEGMYNKRITL